LARRQNRRSTDFRFKSLGGYGPSLGLDDVSQDEFRKLDDKLSKPCILFKQRYNIIVSIFVEAILVPKRRSFEASLRSMRRMCGSHWLIPKVIERAPVFNPDASLI